MSMNVVVSENDREMVIASLGLEERKYYRKTHSSL